MRKATDGEVARLPWENQVGDVEGVDVEFDQEGEPERLRIDTILSRLKSDSFETVGRISNEALRKWVRSGNDPTDLRGVQMSWRTPGGGTEAGFVGAIADR